MPIGIKNATSMQQTLNRSLADGKISVAEATELAAAHKAELAENGPIGAMGSALTLQVIASQNVSKFEPGAEKVVLDALGVTKNEYGSYSSTADGYYSGVDIYNTFQSGAADGKIDATEAQALVQRFRMFAQSNSAAASRLTRLGGGTNVDPNMYYYRKLAVSALIDSLVLGNQDKFAPDALKATKLALELPLAPLPSETAAKIKEDGKVTKPEAQELIADVKANVVQFGGTTGDPAPTLFAFRVEANALLSAPAKAELNKELGIDPNKITYKPTNATLAAVFGDINKDNRINLTEARQLMEMAKQGTGTTDSAVADFKALLALNPSRIDATAKKELQKFVDTMSPKQSEPSYWGDVQLAPAADINPQGDRAMRGYVAGGLPMQQAIARLSRGGNEVLLEVPLSTGMMVNGRFVDQVKVVLTPTLDGKFDLSVLGTALPGPSAHTGGTLTMHGGTFTAEQLLKGTDVSFIGRDVETR